MDKLQEEIDRKRADLADAEKAAKHADKRAAEARHALELRKAELSAYERAAALRPASSFRIVPNLASIDSGSPTANRGGRQPGAISLDWRKVFKAMVVENGNLLRSIQEICLLAESRGVPHDPRSVRERFRKYVALGLAHEEEGKFRVTETAIKRFDLSQKDQPPVALAAGGSNGSGS